MKIEAVFPDGKVQEWTDPGKNFTLGLGAQLFQCVCGQSKFVEGGDDWECPCGIVFTFSEDESEQTGYLHTSSD